MRLRLFNTRTRAQEIFAPIEPPHVRMYACGPTVYNFAHIGNLRTYVFEDVLRRALEMAGYQVLHVMNVTDVGHLVNDADEGPDKVAEGARREGMTAWTLAEKYTSAFFEDIDHLNIRRPHLVCKATDHIKQQIDLVAVLESKGFTYRLSDGIYFDTSKLTDYGHLARLDVAGLQAGARIEVAEGKRNKTDFALWKFSGTPGLRDMEWESPWGIGFPGWHIECSAMALEHLGDRIDIHCGGIDHVPLHHTNEIAQTESATGVKPWVNFWLHGEFLVLERGDKMGKSQDNFLTLRTLRERRFDPLAYRYLCLQAHYRSQLAFSMEALEGAAAGLERLWESCLRLSSRLEVTSGGTDRELGDDARAFSAQFEAAIEDDLNMPQALAVTWAVVRAEHLPPSERLELIRIFDEVVGLDLLVGRRTVEVVPSADLQALLDHREQCRRESRYAEADAVRAELSRQGFEVVDAPSGPKLRKVGE